VGEGGIESARTAEDGLRNKVSGGGNRREDGTDKVFLGVRLPYPLGDTADPFPLFEKLDAFPALYDGLDKVLLPSVGVVDGGGVGGGGHAGRVVGKHREGRRMSRASCQIYHLYPL